MPSIDLQGTKFSFQVLPENGNKNFINAEIEIANEYLSYKRACSDITFEGMEEWLFAMRRLLAGAYGKECNLSFEKEGIAVDLYPYTDNGRTVERAERREKDCVMLVRLLLKSSNGKGFLGGVHSFLFHRKEIETFSVKLREEFDKYYAQRGHGMGKYLFVGVSPQGYKGCNYWYLDPSTSVCAGDYVWVRMGRHNTEQVVYVDSVRRFNDETAPYDPSAVKQVLRKATQKEIKAFLKSVKR
ncbi:MAG: hypothetical protein IJY05_00015 [Clostridia bacterium]|nr:hypothetical protein [Clostridia bacterium]